MPCAKRGFSSPSLAGRLPRRSGKEPSRVKEYDIFVPMYYNDGAPVEPRKLRDLQVRLLEYFQGFTFFPQPNEGVWQAGDVTYRDEIVVYRVVTAKVRPARRFLRQLKEELKRVFRQEEIFIVERNVEVL